MYVHQIALSFCVTKYTCLIHEDIVLVSMAAMVVLGLVSSWALVDDSAPSNTILYQK